MVRLSIHPAWSFFLAASAFAQTQSFTVGQWFYGHNVTSELPAGVTDLTDNMWSSEGHTCPIVIVSGKASLVCRDTVAGGPFNTIVTEGDARLGGGLLAIPTTFATGPSTTNLNPYGRYISSMVRPGPTNLYFTTVVTPGSAGAAFNHQTAFRLLNYQTLQRVAGAGDAITVNVAGQVPVKATLSAAGPMDANSDGREFIYVEAAGQNFYALCELTSAGVYNALYVGRQSMYDSPWGMGGFMFDHTKDHGGIIYRQGSVIDRVDLNLQGSPNPYPTAIQGQIFAPGQKWIPNLLLSGFFRASFDLSSFYLSWGNLPPGNFGLLTPPEFLQQGISPLPDGTGWTSIYESAVGTANETIFATLAASARVAVAGVSPFATASNLLKTNAAAAWPFSNLLYYIDATGSWTSVLQATALPDTATAPKRFYQGVTAHGCQMEFATKQDTGAIDGGGAFYALYRLYRPCLDSASLNAASRELVVTGVNLADQITAVYLVPPGNGPPQGPLPLISATSTEVHATATAFTNGSQVMIVVNGAAGSDPLNVVLSVQPAPILADLTDVNGDHTSPVPLKLMTLWGQFHCLNAQTQTVNYPPTLGNCTVTFENGTLAPLLYASDGQINFLMPSSLPVGAHSVTVSRLDADGTFTSTPFVFNVLADGPVLFKYNGNVIVQVVRGGQAILMAPSDPIHPGEYMTVYITGVNAQSLFTSVTVGGVPAQFAQAFVNWAQGLLQMNILVPPGTGAVPSVAIGRALPFNITVQ